MTDRRFTQIGIDRLVRFQWLEKTSSLVLAGNTVQDIKAALQHDLQSSFRSNGKAVRGSLDKTITILMKVWIRSPAELAGLSLSGLDLLKQVHRSKHIAIHWGMVMAAYPFWASVATQVGRLLRLQDSVAAPHVQRRMCEQYGERETVSRRTRYVLRSFIDWNVLRESEEKGVYVSNASLPIDEPRLMSWLIEAQLHTNPKGRNSYSELRDSLCLFPFQFARLGAKRVLAASEHLELLSDGSSDEMIGLHTSPQRKER